MAPFKRNYRKKTGFRPRKIVKRKRVYRKRSSVAVLARKVNNLQRTAQGELKTINLYYQDIDSALPYARVGLTNGTSLEGGLICDLTPYVIAKGTGRNDRIGNAINLKTMHIRFHLTGQSAQAMNSTLTIELFKNQAGNAAQINGSATWSGMALDLFKADSLTNSRSMIHAPRNTNFYRRFKRFYKKTIRTPQDNGGTSNFIYSGVISLNLRGHGVRWDDGIGLAGGQIFMVVRASNGNASAVTATPAGSGLFGLNTAINTGFLYTHAIDYHYYDN